MTKLAEEVLFNSPSNRAWFSSLKPLDRNTVLAQMKYMSPYDSASKITDVTPSGATMTASDPVGIGYGRELRKQIDQYGMSKDQIKEFLNKDLAKDYTGLKLRQEQAKQKNLKDLVERFYRVRDHIAKANAEYNTKATTNAERFMANVAPKKFNEGINNALKTRDIGTAAGAVGTGLLGGLAANWLARRFTKDNKSNWLTNLATIGATLGAGYLVGKYIGDYAGQSAATKAGLGSEYAAQAPNVNRFADNKAVNYFRNLVG